MVLQATVPAGKHYFLLDDPPKEVDDTLNRVFSYEAPNAEYTDAYKEGRWDGIVRLYDTINHKAPAGLLDRAREVLDRDIDVTIEGDRSGDEVDLDWVFQHDLRQYQRDAVTAVLDEDGGIVSLPTGTGKTITGLRVLYETQKTSGRGIVLVHTQELLYQWADEIRDTLGVEPGLIGDGNWSEGPVTVAVMQTLISRGADQLDNDYGVGIFDECHRTSAAETMHEIGMDLDVEMNVGLSATPWRRVEGEELKIEGIVGSEVYEASAPRMIEEGWLAEPEFDIVDYEASNHIPYGTDYHEAYRHGIVYDVNRNKAVVNSIVKLLADGYKVLVNVDRVAHGRILEYALNTDIEPGDLSGLTDDMETDERFNLVRVVHKLTQSDCDARFIYGGSSTTERQQALDDFKEGEFNVLIGTIFKEGVDIPSCSALVQAAAGKSDISQIQTIGRALRPKNGDHAKLIDFADEQLYFEEQFETRISVLSRYYGEYGPDTDDITVRTKEGRVSLTDNDPTWEEVFGDE